MPINTWADFEGAFYFLRDSKHKYMGYVVDTATMLQQICITASKEKAGLDEDSAMTRRSWGFLSSMLAPMLLNMRDLPMHSCIIAQDRYSTNENEDTDDDDIMPEMGPAVMPSIAKTLNGMVKVIGQTYIKDRELRVKGKLIRKPQFRMRIGPHPFYLTKVRAPKHYTIPASINDPSFSKILSIMLNKYTEVKKKIVSIKPKIKGANNG